MFVLRPVETIPDERPDRNPFGLEPFRLDLYFGGLMLGVPALREKLDVALVESDDSLPGHLVIKPGDDHCDVLRGAGGRRLHRRTAACTVRFTACSAASLVSD